MISRVIEYNIVTDINDLDPNDLVSSYPTVFASSADVPQYLYKSAATLWLGTPSASSDFTKRVNAESWSPQDNAQGSIAILIDQDVPSYLWTGPTGMKSNELGAEVALVNIVVYKPPGITNQSDTIYNTTERLKRILDHHYRSARGLGQLTLSGSNAIDSSLEDGYIKCYHWETRGPGRLTQKNSVAEMIFCCEYKKIFVV